MSGWNRRSFLKAGTLGTTGLATGSRGGLLGPVEKPWNARIHRSLRKFRNPSPTVCRMCSAHCGLIAFRDADRVVQIQGNAGVPTNQGGLCPRAFAGLERLYDAERQLQPLRRKGARGSGEWEPIGWDQALAEISARLWRGGARTVLHVGQEEILVEELRSALGWHHVLVDRPLPGRPGPGRGQRWYGAPTLGPDAFRARTIYLFGIHPLEGRLSVPLARSLVEAQREGASIHLFDSFQGATGSLGRWHPVTPGAEAAVGWGLARLLLEWQAFDREDLAMRVADSPESLASALLAYTPEAVERAAGVPAADLLRLARRLTEERPSVALAPTGSPAQPAAALLNHLTGSVNRPGGMATARGPFFAKPLRPTATPGSWLRSLLDGETRADVYWVVDANPAYDAPRSREVAGALADPERVGFLVAMDTHLTETATLADLFLPLATHFESWGLVEGALADGRSYLLLQQPVTRPASEADKLKAPEAEHLSLFEPWPRPLGQARSLPDTLLELARSDSSPVATFAAIKDTRSYLGELLRKSWGPGSLEALQRRGIWVSEESRRPDAVSEVSLATAIPPAPQPGASGDEAAQGLFLVGREPTTLPRTYSNTRWGREIHHASEALLNPDTARRIGVADGSTVHVKTPAGEGRVRARVVNGVHPRALVLPDGLGHWAGGRVAQAEAGTVQANETAYLVSRKGFLTNPLGLVRSEVDPGEPVWWSGAGPGLALRDLYPFRIGEDGLQDWGALPVEVKKA